MSVSLHKVLLNPKKSQINIICQRWINLYDWTLKTLPKIFPQSLRGQVQKEHLIFWWESNYEYFTTRSDPHETQETLHGLIILPGQFVFSTETHGWQRGRWWPPPAGRWEPAEPLALRWVEVLSDVWVEVSSFRLNQMVESLRRHQDRFIMYNNNNNNIQLRNRASKQCLLHMFLN